MTYESFEVAEQEIGAEEPRFTWEALTSIIAAGSGRIYSGSDLISYTYAFQQA
jgi:hypothetical protein